MRINEKTRLTKSLMVEKKVAMEKDVGIQG